MDGCCLGCGYWMSADGQTGKCDITVGFGERDFDQPATLARAKTTCHNSKAWLETKAAFSCKQYYSRDEWRRAKENWRTTQRGEDVKSAAPTE